jgi:hypothetical protein
MFLNGSLENFSVADILQLLSFSRQSGALYVQGAVDAVLFLEDGDAYFARRDSDSPLGDILFAHGVDESDWSGAVAESAASDAIGETLVTRGAIDGDLLAYVVHRQLTDTLFDLFRMPRRGTFDFRVGERHEIGAIRRYKIDALIDDTRRRVEEWATISEFISSPSAMVSIATELPADTVELTLDRQQWDLLLLAAREDRYTLTEMAHVLERTDAEVAGALDGLIRAGLVTILEMRAPVFEDDPPAHEPDRDGPELTPVDETSWVEAAEIHDPLSQRAEADHPGGQEPVVEADASGSELDHSSASDDPLSSDWFETEIGSWEATSADDAEEAGTWQEAATDESAGDDAGSWQSPRLPEDTEAEIGGWSAVPADTGDESAAWQDPVPLFEDANPGADGQEGAESWWQDAPGGDASSPEWEETWRPTDADSDASSAPEWLAAPEEPDAEEGLSDSIWGDGSTERHDIDGAGGDAPSGWDAPAAGDAASSEPEDGESVWTSEERAHEPVGNPDPDTSTERPPPPAAEEAAGEASDEPGEADTPETVSGEPSNAPEPPEGESSGFRTVALQELRNLAGTPVRLPGPRRQAGSGEALSPPSAAPKIRALKRIIAAVRGL